MSPWPPQGSWYARRKHPSNSISLLTMQTSPDNAYVIAFSLMMLHTDVFNSNNKSKMSKAEYVKNTRLDGVPQIILEVS